METPVSFGLWIRERRFWYLQGYLREGRQWLAHALAVQPLPQASTQRSIQAKVLLDSGALVWGQGDYDHAQGQLVQSLAIYRELGDKAGIANALNFLGNIAGGQGAYAQARKYHQESLLLRQEGWDQ